MKLQVLDNPPGLFTSYQNQGNYSAGYEIVRRQQLDLAGLYRDDVYPAWNWSGFVAFGVPVVLTLLSLGSDAFSWFYSYGWFTGSALGGVLYYGLNAKRASSPLTAKSPL